MADDVCAPFALDRIVARRVEARLGGDAGLAAMMGPILSQVRG